MSPSPTEPNGSEAFIPTETPEQLVDRDGTRRWGRFAGRPAEVNPLDEWSGLTRLRRRLRLKEWVGFMVTHPDWYVSMILQDAKYLGSSEFYAYDRATSTLNRHEAVRPPAGLPLPADLYAAPCSVETAKYRLEIDFSTTPHRITVGIRETHSAAAIQGTLELEPASASAPLSVSSRLAEPGTMYTHKVIYAVEGTLTVGDKDVTYDGARDLAILDEHRTFLPYRTDWTWGTFAFPTANGFVGANFATRPQPDGEEEESCIWVPGACEQLADLTFQPESDDPLATHHIRSEDGRLDVVFEPESRMEVNHNFLVSAIDYYQLSGRYRGVVRGTTGEHTVDDVPGVCETMDARL